MDVSAEYLFYRIGQLSTLLELSQQRIVELEQKIVELEKQSEDV